MTTTSLVLAVIVLGLVGCGGNPGPDSSTSFQISSVATVPAGWVIIQGDSISLALPTTFRGGDPEDPVVGVEFEEIYQFGIFGWWPPEIESPPLSLPTAYDAPLVAWEEPSTEGFVPLVWTMGGMMPSSVSMDEWIEADLGSVGPYSVESLTEDRAHVVVNVPVPGQPDLTLFGYTVYLRAASGGYVVIYICDSESADTYEPIFRASAETIAIE